MARMTFGVALGDSMRGSWSTIPMGMGGRKLLKEGLKEKKELRDEDVE